MQVVMTKDNSKYCASCHAILLFECFSKNNGSYYSNCKKCVNAYYNQPTFVEKRKKNYNNKVFDRLHKQIYQKYPDKKDEIDRLILDSANMALNDLNNLLRKKNKEYSLL